MDLEKFNHYFKKITGEKAKAKLTVFSAPFMYQSKSQRWSQRHNLRGQGLKKTQAQGPNF